MPILKAAGLGPAHSLLTETLNIQPDARDLAELAASAQELEHHVSPLYLRPPDAKRQTGKSISRTIGEAK